MHAGDLGRVLWGTTPVRECGKSDGAEEKLNCGIAAIRPQWVPPGALELDGPSEISRTEVK